MSYQPPYPPQPQPAPMPPGPRHRPAVVTLAAGLMILIALLGIIGAILSLVTMGGVVDRFRVRAARTDATQTDIDNLATVIQVISVVVAVALIIFAIVLIGLAFGNLRGSNVSRVVTWVICGLGVICGCCGIFGAVGQTGTTSFGSGDMDAQTAEDLGNALSDSYPGWWLAISGGLSGLQTLGYIAIAVLLALPAANAFFRKVTPQWQPPPSGM